MSVQALTQQATQREAAERFGVDRSTVVAVCRTAKQGALDALCLCGSRFRSTRLGAGGTDVKRHYRLFRIEGVDRGASVPG
jgi:predicted DNA-binding protein (UPF0251 family)